ncbi:hypothetical protein ACFO1B_26220 [Dactylosporangium siamense]|uniref:DUF3618 domain-containing protein n=1 Tax=Dactylosporangium siamense TaxID=685454 RepID=A0A919U969_9ACTN|nr:hypothetical protein [Dactylosporangium siamense]GIG46512.1 hypothetical protein Dsi01nite_045530 [Dactylosporangium siamense]
MEVEQVFGRREVKTHRRLMQEELGESLGHLRMAAAHAADGASGALAPRVENARNAVKPGLAKAGGAAGTILIIARDRSRQASKQAEKIGRKGKAKMTKNESRRRWPMAVGGLLMAGAAVGAATALMRRRRANQAWDEYGSTRTTSDTGSMLDSAKSTMDAGIDKAKTMGEAAKDRASDLIGSKSTNTGPSGSGEYEKHPMPQAASKNSRS